MAEDEAIFDPTLKKKKKKKTGFNIDAAIGDAPVASTIEESAPQENGVEAEPNEDAMDGEDGEFGKKKSKKKKKAFNLDDIKDSVSEINDSEETSATVDNMDYDNMDMYMTKKKKKRQKPKFGLDDLLAVDESKNDDDNRDDETGESWNETDRDYTYDELLQRAFAQLREKNPDMATGEKKKFVMKPPQVVRIGSKKSAFVNFAEICRLLHRIPKHVLQFLLAELGTSGSIDGSSQLIIKGRFQQKQIENVLRRYIKEYVTCHTCRSPDTILQKDARLYFLQCEQCNSRCSVAPIKSGFQAVANKQQRQAIRANKN